MKSSFTNNDGDVKIYIQTDKIVTYSDICLILEDKLSSIYPEIYNEKILNKSLDKMKYSIIINEILDKINNLSIYVNNYLFMSPIIEDVHFFDLTNEIIKVIFWKMIYNSFAV